MDFETHDREGDSHAPNGSVQSSGVVSPFLRLPQMP